MIIIIITLIDIGALQGQYKQIDINVVNKHDDNVLNIPTDQLAILTKYSQGVEFVATKNKSSE